MSSQSVAKADQATGVVPAAPWRVRALSVLPQWQLVVTFNDDLMGVVDVSAFVQAPDAGVFAALRDPAFFASAAPVREKGPGSD